MKIITKTLLTFALMWGFMNTASAYVGPGAGLSLLGALWGLLAAIFAALAFVLMWPLRKMMKARRDKGTPAH
jgi:drug/metabolite transporter (DMT)-like permease